MFGQLFFFDTIYFLTPLVLDALIGGTPPNADTGTLHLLVLGASYVTVNSPLTRIKTQTMPAFYNELYFSLYWIYLKINS